MARLEIGDRVLREMRAEADYVGVGTILVILPNHPQLQIFDEYDVDFGRNGILIAYSLQSGSDSLITMKAHRVKDRFGKHIHPLFTRLTSYRIAQFA